MGKKSKKRNKKPWVGILAAILVGVIAFAAIFQMTQGLTQDLNVMNFAVIHKGEWYLGNARGLSLKEGDVLEVKHFEAVEKIEVEVWSIPNASENVVFTFGNKKYSWNESIGARNVSSAFDISVTQASGNQNGKIKIEGGGIGDVVSIFTDGATVSFEPFDRKGEFFRLIVKCGTSQLYLDFSFTVSVAGIAIDQGGISFK